MHQLILLFPLRQFLQSAILNVRQGIVMPEDTDDNLKSELTPEEHEALSKKASNQPRDEHGHFVSQKPMNPLTKFLHDETRIRKSGDDDELIDIHIGNPLRRITELLEQIKRQKAFSFTLKGSLGLMGVALVAGSFSILGGSKILCDKGTQTKFGSIRELTYMENSDLTLLDYIPVINSFIPQRRINRKILVDSSGKITHLLFKNDTTPLPLQPNPYFLTGNYDSCSESLTIDQQTGIQANLQ